MATAPNVDQSSYSKYLELCKYYRDGKHNEFGEVQDMFVEPFFMDEDPELWAAIGRSRGILQMRRSADEILHFAQLHIPAEEIEYFVEQRLILHLLIFASLLESLVRVFLRFVPHFCARSIAETRMQMGYRLMTIYDYGEFLRERGETDPQLLGTAPAF